jgi:hypothetical protein
MKIAHRSAVWMTTLFTLSAPAIQASDENTRPLPLVNSFYQDDESCSEHVGEATQRVTWNGQAWYLTAPVLLVSPPAETKRVGTPLDVRPLDVFVNQAQLREANVASGDAQLAKQIPIRLRLVLAVHDLTSLGPGTYSLQSIIAVRLCGAVKNAPSSLLYVGPRKGVNIKDWWNQRKSERWINAYRDAFSLAVADALDWAADNAIVLTSRDGK